MKDRNIYSDIETFFRNFCTFKKLYVPGYEKYKDPRGSIINYFEHATIGKAIIEKFIKECIECENDVILNKLSKRDVIELFVDVIHEYNIDPFSIKVVSRLISDKRYSNFWDKYSN